MAAARNFLGAINSCCDCEGVESAKQSAIDNEFVTQSNDWKKWLFKENYFAEESMLNALKKEDRVSKHYEMGKYLLYIKFSEKLGKDYTLT